MIDILVTGGAGFIGSTLIDKLLQEKKYNIICVDNFDSFYDKDIKKKNIEQHKSFSNYSFYNLDIRDIHLVNLHDKKIDVIIHLAGKAGVRPSIEDPLGYFENNLNGTLKMPEFARKKKIKHFIFGSSSSVYGNSPGACREDNMNLYPISPYAASKLSAEKAGFTYSHLYGIRFIGLRLFSVFGPKQRPDLAINNFFFKMRKKEIIEVFGNGATSRDYTYVDDIVNGIISAIYYTANNFELFNLGNNKPIKLIELIHEISSILQLKPIINFLPEQQGDVSHTCADISKGESILNYTPSVSLSEGLHKQYEWIKNQRNG